MTMFQNLRRMMDEGQTLKIECVKCGHRGEWSRRQAFRTFGDDSAPHDIRKRARCSVCKWPTELKVWI